MTAFKDLNVTVWHENLGLNNGQAMKLSELYDHFKFQLIDDGFIEANPKRFKAPTIDEVRQHFISKKRSCADADKFYNHWDSVDWYTKGKVRIKSWKGRAATWIGNNYEKNSKYSKPNELDDESTSWGHGL